MVCKHSKGDPSCTSQYPRSYNTYAVNAPETPDASKYSILEAHREGPHLVIKAAYPNCKKCSYEGHKIMVFLYVEEVDVLKWKEIDPHFRNTKNCAWQAPSPAARFPACPEGWDDAINYAKSKNK